MNTKKKGNFMLQGAILGFSSILVRVIGIIYRVPLNNILGEKGIAYYGVAFDVYSILLLLSSYSMPLAVSKMVSRRITLRQYTNTKRILMMSFGFALTAGVIAFLITFFGADLFANLLNYPQSAIALKMLSPALIILSVLGVLRGFFQGLGTMIPTAVSNIFEQIVNAVVSIVAASALYKSVSDAVVSSYEFSNVREAYGAAGGTLGTVCGAGAALLFLLLLFFMYKKILERNILRERNPKEEPYKNILKVLVLTVVPVILSTTIYNISGLLDSGLFSNILEARGYDHDTIDILTGMFSGNYRLIVQVPIALASALASSLIPSVVQSVTERDHRGVIRKVESSIKVSMIIAMPCAVGIGVLSKPIINFLFPTSVDPDKLSLMLMIGCVSVVLYSLSTITNSILQGIDKMRVPVIHSAIALAIHVAVLALMLFIFRIDIFCLVICDMLFALIVCILNAKSLKKYLHFKQEKMKSFILPAICSLVMGIFVFFFYKVVYLLLKSNIVCVFLSILFAVAVYGLLLILLKVISKKELKAFPGGTKIIAVAEKLRLM